MENSSGSTTLTGGVTLGAPPTSGLTAAQKKRLKKKGKAKSKPKPSPNEQEQPSPNEPKQVSSDAQPPAKEQAEPSPEAKPTPSDQPQSSEAPSGGEKKKKKRAKAKAKAKATPKARGAAAKIKQLREEQERRQREEEERRRREEEELRKAEEEEAKRVERLKKKKEEKKKRLAENKKKRAEEEKQKQREIALARFTGMTGVILPTGKPKPKAKKVAYGKKKKTQPKPKPTPAGLSEEKLPEQSAAAKEEVAGTTATVEKEVEVAETNDTAEEKVGVAATADTAEEAEVGKDDSEQAPEESQSKAEESDVEVDNWEELGENTLKISTGWDDEDETQAVAIVPQVPTSPLPAKAPKQSQLESSKEPQAQHSMQNGSEEASSKVSGSTKAKTKGKSKKDKRQNKQATAPEKPVIAADKMRSPICCILGHVDTGKTKLLDKIRNTKVQEGEAGGITQQIGATYFPLEAIQEQTRKLQEQFKTLEYKIPGLLIIDTPGHEAFNNLRSRGSSLCDIAILVVDIMHGLEPQTIESIELLKMRKTPFVVALNKIDRIYGWNARPFATIKDALDNQLEGARAEFNQRVRETVAAFASQRLNACLYYDNKDFRKFVSLVPTSALTGEGIPDLLMLLVTLTQKMMASRLLELDTLSCTVLEVKVVEGLGTTIDVILVNGVLHEGDTIVLCGMEGPIVTTVRALLTPQPMKELRVKTPYVHHKQIKAAQGLKICANGLENALAGTQLFVYDEHDPDQDLDELKEEVQTDLATVLNAEFSAKGVFVQASTIGSLEALLVFLKQSKIPVCGVNIGPIHKKDLMRASTMLEHDKTYAVILAFDVKVDRDIAAEAERMGVKIFSADIIYHLFDMFTEYYEKTKKKKQEEMAAEAVFPAVLRILPECIFNMKHPLVFGVHVEAGNLHVGTPLAIPSKNNLYLGRVIGIESNHNAVEVAKTATDVCIKVDTEEHNILYGRHFDHNDVLYSKITRASLNVLKENFKDQLTQSDVQLLVRMKQLFGVV